MNMTNSEPIVYLRGQMVPASQAHINIYDLSIVQGASVTDLVRTFRHRPFRLDDHVDRFYRSAKYARINPPLKPDQTIQRINELIEHNASLIDDEQDLGIVMFMSPGEVQLYAGTGGVGAELTPTFCIHSFPMAFQMWKHLFDPGVHLVTPSIRHVPPQCLDPKIKNRSRMHWWVAEQETHLVDPQAIPLLLDLDGNITETAGSNIVIVSGGRVISPSPRNILRGVSLMTVVDLCMQLGIDFVERDLQVYDVINAEEAMLPTSPYCLAPVVRINGIPIADGRPGPVFAQLMKAWSELVGMDVLKQIQTVRFE